MSSPISTMTDIDRAIRQHRTTQATVTISHNGSPVAGQDVVVQQTKHKFLFGTNWGHRSNLLDIKNQSNVAIANALSLLHWDRSSVALANGELSGKEKELAELHHAHFIQLCNQVTLPFYWGGFEAARGQPQTERLLTAARWYKDQGCVVKGHPLCWQTVTPNWLTPMSNADVLDAQVARIQREVSNFAGIIDMWDVINEAVIMPVYEKYENAITRLAQELGRIELIRRVFETARATNPNAMLIINDFDTSSAYDILIEGCLAAGIQFDVIGIQSHMHKGYWGVEKTLKTLDHFERFKLPVHFSEVSLLSGELVPPENADLQDCQVEDWRSTPEGEARQLEQAILHYKTLMSHPAVEAITWWDMSDGAWLNAPAGLLRRDQSPKPAYDALLKLVKGEWWLAPTTMTTDEKGRISFTGFLGDYQLSIGSERAIFSLGEKGETAVSVNLKTQ